MTHFLCLKTFQMKKRFPNVNAAWRLIKIRTCMREEARGVMPLQSEGARARDVWAKWIFKAASKGQKIAE